MSREMTAEFAHVLFRYEEETGVLYWRERPVEHFSDESYWLRWNNRHAFQPAGNVGNVGYLRVNIAGKFYTNHRIIWFLVHGEWPKQVDHINGNKTDNRIANLRDVSHTINARNMRQNAANTSGITGVSFDSSAKKWHAYIGIGDNRRKSLGMFNTLEEAAAARKGAEKVLDYHENHGRAA